MYRVAQIQELEQRIKSHTAQMAERRRKPKGTPQEEMEAARRDLEIVSKLLAFLFFFQNLHQTSNPMCQHLVCVDLYSVISVLWSDASQNLCVAIHSLHLYWARLWRKDGGCLLIMNGFLSEK